MTFCSQGFTVSQVVHDYGDVCQTDHRAGDRTNAPISTDDFRMLNQCLDDAIASAVTHIRARKPAIPRRRGETAARASGWDSSSMNCGTWSTPRSSRSRCSRQEMSASQEAPAACSIAASWDCAISSARSLDEVRLTQWREEPSNRSCCRIHRRGRRRPPHWRRTPRRHQTNRRARREGLAIEADRQVLSAVVGNLLQNAFKFTRPRTTVTLSVGASDDRVLIEVQDECGGLPGANTEGTVPRVRATGRRSNRPGHWARVQSMGRRSVTGGSRHAIWPAAAASFRSTFRGALCRRSPRVPRPHTQWRRLVP